MGVSVFLGAAKDVITSIGFIVAGSWTYLLFVRQRQRFPRAELAHKVAYVHVTDRQALVHVTVAVKNLGSVLIRLRQGYVQIQQVKPLPVDISNTLVAEGDPVGEGCTEVPWPLLGRRDCTWDSAPQEIEPGESEEFHFDFLIASEVQTIETYSYLRNMVKYDREIGWNHTTLCELECCRIDVNKTTEGRLDDDIKTRGR